MAGNSNSGRPSKPAVVHLLQGNRSKKSAAALLTEVANPLVPVDAPDMPDWLDDYAVEEWQRVVPDLLKLRLISKLDRQALAQYCEAVSDFRRHTLQIQEINKGAVGGVRGDLQTSRNGHQGLSGLRQLRTDAERRVNEAGRQFGFTPMSRRTLKAPVPQGELFPNEQKQIAEKYF